MKVRADAEGIDRLYIKTSRALASKAPTLKP
jgi:hypothetical protein